MMIGFSGTLNSIVYAYNGIRVKTNAVNDIRDVLARCCFCFRR